MTKQLKHLEEAVITILQELNVLEFTLYKHDEEKRKKYSFQIWTEHLYGIGEYLIGDSSQEIEDQIEECFSSGWHDYIKEEFRKAWANYHGYVPND